MIVFLPREQLHAMPSPVNSKHHCCQQKLIGVPLLLNLYTQFATTDQTTSAWGSSYTWLCLCFTNESFCVKRLFLEYLLTFYHFIL